jgi:hypothetical protein
MPRKAGVSERSECFEEDLEDGRALVAFLRGSLGIYWRASQEAGPS